MNKKKSYPLTQLLDIKKHRVEEREKIVIQKKEALKKEKENLKNCERKRDEVKDHYLKKLTQLRKEMDQNTTGPKLQQMKNYLMTAIEKLEEEENKVKKQQKVVSEAEDALEEAKKKLNEARLEVDKIETHRSLWLKAEQKELDKEEQNEMNEIGTALYLQNKKKQNK